MKFVESRILTDDELDPALDVTCRCGKVHRLWFNGGELDQRQCDCGYRFRLEHVAIRLVVEDVES